MATAYKVYVQSYLGAPRDHVSLVVVTDPAKMAGEMYHVEGSIQAGMKYVHKKAQAPLQSVSFQKRMCVGQVAAADLPKVQQICASIPPPAKQYDGPKLLVPKEKVRRCGEWTKEAVAALKAAKVVVGQSGAWETRAELEAAARPKTPPQAAAGAPKKTPSPSKAPSPAKKSSPPKK